MQGIHLAFFNEIATHLSGARNDRLEKQVFLNLDLELDLFLYLFFQDQINHQLIGQAMESFP